MNMNEVQAFQSLGIQAEDIFRNALYGECYGNYLFELVEKDYHLFAPNEPGDAVWLVEDRSQDGAYRIVHVEEARKFHTQPIVPSPCNFNHCEPIDDTLLEDRRVESITTKIKQGGKTLGQKLNKAYIDVITASLLEEAKIPVQEGRVDEALADVFSRLVKEGYRPNKFLFPQHLEGKLVQQKIIVRDNEIHNPHYVGKTITGQDAFWANDLPGDVAFILDSNIGITLTNKPKFYITSLGAFLPGVCGAIRLNPIVKNRKGIIALMGIEQALSYGTVKRVSITKTRSGNIYVDLGRIEELRAIASPSFDLAKLIRLCEELNTCYDNECYFAVAMLTRAILDHVPPIFGCKNFTEVANNYGGSKSFKECMEHLANSSKKIGDAHLHVQIRSKETLPNQTQVNFSSDLDVLLAEVVRILK